MGRGFGPVPLPMIRASTRHFVGGDERTRTADPLLAKQVLYQLSYVPLFACGNSEPRPSTRLLHWITSQHLTD